MSERKGTCGEQKIRCIPLEDCNAVQTEMVPNLVEQRAVGCSELLRCLLRATA